MNSEQEPRLANEEPSHVTPELPSPAGSSGSRISSHPAPATDTVESRVAAQPPVTVRAAHGGAIEHSLLLQEFKDLLRQYIGVKGCVNSSRFDLVSNPKANENRRGPPSQSSVYRGVTRHMRTRKWEAHIWQRKQLYLGGFEDAVDAAKAHDIMSLKLKQEAASTNFMRESYRPLLPYITRLSWEYIMSALRQCTKEPSSLRVEGPMNNQRGPYGVRRPELRPQLDQGMIKRPRTTLAESTGFFRSYKSGQNLGGIAVVPRPRSFGQVRHQWPYMSTPGRAIKGIRASPFQSYSEYLSFLSNQLDHIQRPGAPFFDATRMMDHSVQSYFADPGLNQVSTTLHPLFSNCTIGQRMDSEYVESYLDARSAPPAPDVQILPGRVIGNVIRKGSDSPERIAGPVVVPQSTSPVETMIKTEAMTVSTTLAPDMEPILQNGDMGSSGSSNDLEMKAAIRAVAGVDDYEIGSFDFLSDPSGFDHPWQPFW